MICPRFVHKIPTLENGSISADQISVTWQIKDGLKWSDGTDVTADDVIFTCAYCMRPTASCAQRGKCKGVKSGKVIDELTVKVTNTDPKPNPLIALVGAEAPISQKAPLAERLGAAAQPTQRPTLNRTAPARSWSPTLRSPTASSWRPNPTTPTQHWPPLRPSKSKMAAMWPELCAL
jgi:ABC-type transport system substrate-binding protein